MKPIYLFGKGVIQQAEVLAAMVIDVLSLLHKELIVSEFI